MKYVLVADDDPLVRDVVKEALAAEGYLVGLAEDGAEALELVRSHQPDVIVLDCSMPGMNGIEALQRIRLSSASYRTPVIMLTARRSPQDIEIAMRAGATEYMRKPFDVDRLIVHVEDALAKGAATARAESSALPY